MNRRSANMLVNTRDRRGRGSIVTKVTSLSARAVATTYLALLLIGLLVVAGCSHDVAATPMEQAMAEFDRDHWDATIAACNAAIAQNPENTAAYLLRGRAQHLAGRLDQAVADLTIAIRLNPQDPEAYYQRANAYRALGQLARKDEDNMTARKLDPSYTYQLKTDVPMPLDPALIAPNGESGKKAAAKEPDDKTDLSSPPTTETQPKRSVVMDMLGLPSDLLEGDRLAPSSPQAQDTNARSWAPPTEAETRAATNRGLAGPDPGVGGAGGSKSPGGLGATGRIGPLPSARDGIADGKNLPAADERRGQPAAKAQRGNVTENRNLRPYGPSSMRPTGMRDAPAFVDPRTGLPAGQGRAATVGTPYIAPNPYAPMGQTSGVGAQRNSAPPRPLFPPPPGNRYDGGRGYGY
jgi:tetratricopeptide (TPR) repeat protein